ncbi:hypothetical protein M413DRAFT_138873 [Hebeloma cylindrosporum]|uniref:Uncharacterized protein n=1 Tax=Hebeloma cylindrosporum TaxID=76867 RepID=A0A0C3CC63_HEBCY|nr:hypothetical protein M413DRAFT_138873 [Hebeloma cylindrosporum h7]
MTLRCVTMPYYLLSLEKLTCHYSSDNLLLTTYSDPAIDISFTEGAQLSPISCKLGEPPAASLSGFILIQTLTIDPLSRSPPYYRDGPLAVCLNVQTTETTLKLSP